jgi:hypothetical protein
VCDGQKLSGSVTIEISPFAQWPKASILQRCQISEPAKPRSQPQSIDNRCASMAKPDQNAHGI